MMKLIKIGLLTLFSSFLLCVNMFASHETDFSYELEAAGIGQQGVYLVKVTILQKKNKVDVDYIKKCAVHGVLFRGFASKEYRTSQKPLAGSSSLESEFSDYYSLFFKDGGAYNKYANLTSEKFLITKVGKQYRISAFVTVMKEMLYQDLKTAGVVKSLNSGF